MFIRQSNTGAIAVDAVSARLAACIQAAINRLESYKRTLQTAAAVAHNIPTGQEVSASINVALQRFEADQITLHGVKGAIERVAIKFALAEQRLHEQGVFHLFAAEGWRQ
jgi:hypothetical protein